VTDAFQLTGLSTIDGGGEAGLPRQLLGRALGYLLDLSREHHRPKEALGKLPELRRAFPTVRLELIWETQPYDDCVHYDLLVSGGGLPGTVSLAFAPDRAIPWPLRGAQRSDEAFLVHVNGRALKVAEAIAALETLWHDDRAVRQILDTALISQVLLTDPPAIEDQDLQSALDDFRRALGLHTAEATWSWMRARGLSQEQLEQRLERAAASRALRRRMTEQAAQAALDAPGPDYDIVRLGRVVFECRQEAAAVAEAIACGATDFLQAARTRLMQQTPGAPLPVLCCQHRHRLEGPLRERLTGLAPPALLGPLDHPGGSELVMVYSVTPASPDQATRQEIQRVLFERWLAEQRQSAQVRWNWGDAETLRNQPALEDRQKGPQRAP
jgi:putative peptide maturation system protein